MADTETTNDGDILSRMGTNGQLWAQEFAATALRLGYSEMDEGWLIGWFANAIEAGRTAGRAEGSPQPAEPRVPDRIIPTPLDVLIRKQPGVYTPKGKP